mgnify:CR=1 FL=1
MASSVYDKVIGQEHTLIKLRALATSAAHAYLFVGPSGCGKDIAARAFAAVKLQGSEDSTQRTADLAMRGIHVDIHEVEREGAGISMEQARDEIIKLAERSAVEGSTRVIIVHDFQLLADGARASLLKTIEEPDGETVMIMLSDDVPDTMITIASRCVRIDFQPITDELIIKQLVDDGVDQKKATAVARVAAGDLERARVLINDPSLASRTELFANVPTRLNGTTSRAIEIAAELLSVLGHDSSVSTLADVQRHMAKAIPGFGATTTAVAVKRDGVVVSVPVAAHSTVVTSAPPRNSYEFRLNVSRKLYDRAISTLTSPALENLAPGAQVLVNPLDLDRVGAPEGGNVRVSNNNSSLVLPVHSSPSVPRGVALVPFNQPGADIRELIRRSDSVVDVRIESI